MSASAKLGEKIKLTAKCSQLDIQDQDLLKYAGKPLNRGNLFGLLIFITHFIILTDELRVQIRYVYRNNYTIGFFFTGFNRLIW